MEENLKAYVQKTFGLTEKEIRSMTEEELDDLYEKACDNEEEVACRCNGEECEELVLAADFTDWVAREA